MQRLGNLQHDLSEVHTMNRTEHLLCILAEESVEVSQRVSKALRFGLTEIQPGQTKTNAERIFDELLDQAATIDMLRQAHPTLFVLPDDAYAEATIVRKQQKVEEYLKLSASCGTLS
jgi:hypothetical protein